MLTIVTTCWQGSRPGVYQPWNVAATKEQFRRHLTIPHKFVCLTDDVRGVESAGVEAYPLWKPTSKTPASRSNNKWLDNWGRLGLADPLLGGRLGDWLLSIDLDCVIRANLDKLVRKAERSPACFTRRQGKGGLLGTLWAVRPGELEPNPWRVLHDDPDIWNKTAHLNGTDQSILTYLFMDKVKAAELPSWTEADGLAFEYYKQPGWRIFTRGTALKCWAAGMPERADYYRESGLEPEIPGGPKISPVPRQ